MLLNVSSIHLHYSSREYRMYVAKHVFEGPVWDGGNNDAPQLLHSAVRYLM